MYDVTDISCTDLKFVGKDFETPDSQQNFQFWKNICWSCHPRFMVFYTLERYLRKNTIVLPWARKKVQKSKTIASRKIFIRDSSTKGIYRLFI